MRSRNYISILCVLGLVCALASQALAVNPAVAPGGSVTFAPTLSQEFSFSWEVLNPAGSVVGSSTTPNSWNVTDVVTGSAPPVISTLTVTCPAGTANGTGYKAFIQGPSRPNGGPFDVQGGTPVVLSSVAVNPNVVLSQASPGPTGTVTLSGPSSGTTTVSLASSLPSIVGVPSSVAVTNGNSSATFSTTIGTVAASQTATITATYSGGQKTATVTVNDELGQVISAIQAQTVQQATEYNVIQAQLVLVAALLLPGVFFGGVWITRKGRA